MFTNDLVFSLVDSFLAQREQLSPREPLNQQEFSALLESGKNSFMGLSGRRSLSPHVSPSYAPRFFLAPRTFKRLPRRLRIDRSPSRSLFCQLCNIFVLLLVSSSDPCPPGLILHASAQYCQGKRFVYSI